MAVDACRDLVSGAPDVMHSAGMLEAAQADFCRVCWGCQWLLVEDLAAGIIYCSGCALLPKVNPGCI